MQLLRNYCLLALMLGLVACDKAQESVDKASVKADIKVVEKTVIEQQKKVTGWPAHLVNVPKEWVSASRPLSIEFSHNVIGDSPKKTPLQGLLTVEPNIPLSVYFSSERKLSIEFPEALDRDVQYQFTLFAQKLDGIENSLEPYSFKVQAFKQDLSVKINGLQIGKSEKDHTISGVIETNDAVTDGDIEKVLKSSQDNKKKSIAWKHESDTRHRFTIKEVSRSEQASSVNIQWDGSAVGVAKKGDQSVLVPAISSFEILGALAHQGSGQYVEVNFSEPLQRSQSIRSFVTLNGNAPKNVRIDGNKILVYPRGKLSGDVSVVLSKGVKSTKGAKTLQEFKKELTFLSENPGVRFVGNSHIIPKQAEMIVPIEAVNVDSVQVTAYRVPFSNLGQFVQSSGLKRGSLHSTTTTPLWRKTYALPEIPKDQWQKFDLNINNITADLGADLYALEIKIDRSHIILECGDKSQSSDDLNESKWATDNPAEEPEWVERYYRSQGYASWRDRQNPCKDYFYSYGNKTRGFKYFSSSNLGVIAKMTVDQKVSVVVTDINNAQPIQDANVTAFNYQHQPVDIGSTDANGFVTLSPVSAPYYLLASHDGDVSFIRLTRNEALSTNVFDVGGASTSSGIKGLFYGERDVWRPGDDIFLTFVVQDKTQQMPDNYPLTLDFFDPKGNKKDSITNANPVNGFYHYALKTGEQSLTGNWRAVIRYGGQYFDKKIPVEAIVPNRLKIELDFPEKTLSAQSVSKSSGIDIGMFSQWLNGAPANRLKADIQVIASASRTRVAGFDAYIFDDPSRQLKSQPQTIFKGKLNSEGRADVDYQPSIVNAPGQVRLNFTTRVFEKSGNFSTQYISKNYIPYAQLVGLNVPEGSGWNDSISRNEKHNIQFLSVDPEGERIANSDLELSLYRVGWRWWWDYSNDDIQSYISRNHHNRLAQADLKTDANGQANWELDGSAYDWGRYLIRVCDKKSDHCSGKIAYLGWSYNNSKNPSGDTQLMLTTDKKRYKVGDTAYITVPQALPAETKNIRFLLSIESGTQILSQRWVNDDIVDNKIAITITEDMAPNVYAHMSLIQGYENKGNDSPIRLYGITPILVDNPNTILQPQISTKEVVRPEAEMLINVSEQSGRAMTYTLAVVDEGLLGLTNYKTPDPNKTFNRREALGVLTWDIYNLIANSAARALNSLITLGGSDSGDDASKADKRRFPPVVKFVGPFYLDAGEKAEHKIQLPEYMGAVRVMVVAGDSTEQGQYAYGSVEKTVTVTQPLTLLATLPRVLGPNESFSLPVSVFVNDSSIQDVAISVEANELFEYETTIPALRFEKIGDQIIDIPFKTLNAIGSGKVTITAKSGNELASQTVNIPIRTANEPQVVSQSMVVNPGETQTLSITPNGLLNTNQSFIEVSRMPDIGLADKLDYLIGYPHGCLEQTTSKLFPQIYLNSLLSLDEEQKKKIESHVRKGINKLQSFQRNDGAFNYWPNGSYYNRWSNTYAGHFLLEAKRLGYVVPNDMLSKWTKHQQNLVKDFSNQKGYESTQAYTLYTLAIANKPNFNAMNRLKERLVSDENESSRERLARWLLAAAYAKAGTKEAAEALMTGRNNKSLRYQWSGYTYGSSLRDEAILMTVYKELGDNKQAWETSLSMAKQFNNKNQWYSTQTTAWVLSAISSYFAGTDSKAQKLSYRVNQGAWEKLSITSPLFQQSVDAKNQPITLEIKNESDDAFYALLGNKGVPANKAEREANENLDISVRYTDMKGNDIDVSRLKQGTDFKALVTVSALENNYARLENLALTMTMPSGWQISNDRLTGKGLQQGLEYQDIRDDRVLSYFTLGRYYYYHRYNRRSITVEVTLNASFKGRFYMPGWQAKSMYDENIHASLIGQWIEVVSDADSVAATQ